MDYRHGRCHGSATSLFRCVLVAKSTNWVKQLQSFGTQWDYRRCVTTENHFTECSTSRTGQTRHTVVMVRWDWGWCHNNACSHVNHHPSGNEWQVIWGHRLSTAEFDRITWQTVHWMPFPGIVIEAQAEAKRQYADSDNLTECYGTHVWNEKLWQFSSFSTRLIVFVCLFPFFQHFGRIDANRNFKRRHFSKGNICCNKANGSTQAFTWCVFGRWRLPLRVCVSACVYVPVCVSLCLCVIFRVIFFLQKTFNLLRSNQLPPCWMRYFPFLYFILFHL